MRRFLIASVSIIVVGVAPAHADEWQIQHVNAPARIVAVDTIGGKVRVNAGGLWYELSVTGDKASLAFIDVPARHDAPEGALPDGRIATGSHDIAQAWFAQPTERYDHGILGDKTEAGSLVIETRDGRRQTVKLDDDAVFEDLEPRIADLDGSGHDYVIAVKSYLKRGSALALIAERRGRYQVVAETPPLGAPHRWLDPAGIADFLGNGRLDIALVRQPHIDGTLELWSWNGNALRKVTELAGVTNHVPSTRAIDMRAVADFNGDHVADIALPSLDRKQLRIVTFAPSAHEIASVTLPAEAATDIGLLHDGTTPVIALGLADGSLITIRKQ